MNHSTCNEEDFLMADDIEITPYLDLYSLCATKCKILRREVLQLQQLRQILFSRSLLLHSSAFSQALHWPIEFYVKIFPIAYFSVLMTICLWFGEDVHWTSPGESYEFMTPGGAGVNLNWASWVLSDFKVGIRKKWYTFSRLMLLYLNLRLFHFEICSILRQTF